MSETFFGSQHPPKPQCDGNHFRLFGHHLCTAREPSQVMARIAVVVLNINCVGLADNMAFGRQNKVCRRTNPPQSFAHMARGCPGDCFVAAPWSNPCIDRQFI
jgi:hypothetical protein